MAHRYVSMHSTYTSYNTVLASYGLLVRSSFYSSVASRKFKYKPNVRRTYVSSFASSTRELFFALQYCLYYVLLVYMSNAVEPNTSTVGGSKNNHRFFLSFLLFFLVAYLTPNIISRRFKQYNTTIRWVVV